MPKQPPLYSSFPQPYPPSSGSRHAIAALAELRTNHSYLQLMISNPGTSLPVMYSTPRAEAVARYVAARYAMAGPLECSLLHRGFNDSFEVRSDGGQHAVLRLSNKRARGDADVASETAFVAYLDGAGIPVAAPVPARDGTLFGLAQLPEGPRPAVLFRHAEGRAPQWESTADARANGVTLARIHRAASSYADVNEGRYRLDLDHLLRRPLSALLGLKSLDASTKEAFKELASRLSSAVAARGNLTWTRCHGDCHGFNARIIENGPNAGQAMFFDFDDGGPGYVAYDLAVFLWARVSFQRRGHAMWHEFIDAYRSIHPIAPADFEATHLFVPIRHIWLLGEYASRIEGWGSQNVPATFLIKELDFLLSWEREKLSPGLF
jgi:Ser/Thr protein kinase RdoA (MazF antagonist)